MQLSPVYIEKTDNIFVARDDLLPGGTKRRAVEVFMDDGDELVYASPAQGYAQVALAYGGQDFGKRITIFVAERKQLHPLTQQTKNLGAKIIQVPMGFLSNVTSKAKKYCQETGAVLLPFGLHDERFIDRLSSSMKSIDIQPSELWCVASSGTIAIAMQRTWPRLKMNCIQVGHLPIVSNSNLYKAPEKYEQPAKIKPPFPSCINYDAKAWRFVQQYAKDEALFWNVGA